MTKGDRERIVLTREQDRVLKLYRAGISQSEIARVVQISRQRVSQIVQRLRELDLIDKTRKRVEPD